MAGRQRTTFQKRQKEVKRLEKQKMKREKRTARREERAQNRARLAGSDDLSSRPSEEGAGQPADECGLGPKLPSWFRRGLGGGPLIQEAPQGNRPHDDRFGLSR